jgi:hypothetical protein
MYLARFSAEIQQRMEEDKWKNNRRKERNKMIKREGERERKKGDNRIGKRNMR